MGPQIIQQPDGRLAVFSSITDSFIVVDATPDELVEWRAEEAAEAARERTRRELDHVLDNNSRSVYFQFALTWEEAARLDSEHGGGLEAIEADHTTEQ